jgi:hypothetical protein
MAKRLILVLVVVYAVTCYIAFYAGILLAG